MDEGFGGVDSGFGMRRSERSGTSSESSDDVASSDGKAKAAEAEDALSPSDLDDDDVGKGQASKMSPHGTAGERVAGARAGAGYRGISEWMDTVVAQAKAVRAATVSGGKSPTESAAAEAAAANASMPVDAKDNLSPHDNAHLRQAAEAVAAAAAAAVSPASGEDVDDEDDEDIELFTVEELTQRIKHQRRELRAAAAERAELAEQLEGARGAHEETVSALARSTCREESAKAELRRSAERCAEVEAGRRSARAALAEMASQNARLVSAFSAKKEEVKTLRSELERTKKAHESTVEGLESRLQASQAEAGSLREMLTRRDAELSKADAALNAAQSASRAAAREAEKLRERAASWERQRARGEHAEAEAAAAARDEDRLAARVAQKELEVERAHFAAERQRWEAERKRWANEISAVKDAAAAAGANAHAGAWAKPTASKYGDSWATSSDRPPPRDAGGHGAGSYRGGTRTGEASSSERMGSGHYGERVDSHQGSQHHGGTGTSRSQPASPTRGGFSSSSSSSSFSSHAAGTTSNRTHAKAASPLRKAASFAAKNAAAAAAAAANLEANKGTRSAPASPKKASTVSSRHKASAAAGVGANGSPRAKAEHHKVKGNNEFHAKRYEAALAQYSAGLALAFEDDAFRAILHANRAAALQAMRQYCDAVMDCCASHLLDPGYLRARQRRADAYLSMGDWPNAVKDLEALAPHMGSDCTTKLNEARRKVKKGSNIDHYAVLGLSQAASQAEVKQAYRQLALKHHPDKAPKAELRNVAESLFKNIAQAYAVLSDVAQRKRYDSSLVMARFKRSGY